MRSGRQETLLVVVRQKAEQRASSELRYLREMNRLEAAAAFDAVIEARPDEAAERLPDEPWLLLQDPAPTLIGRASLAVLRRAAARHGAAFPIRLDRTGSETAREIQTLRDYEILESELLPRLAGRRASGNDPVPALLTTRAHLSERLEPSVWGAWCSGETDLPGLAAALGAQPAGLCHCFVDYYGSARDDVLPLLPTGAVDVLDVGCGKGHTGELLRRERGCRVTGVELNPHVAEEARARLDHVVVGDVMEVEIEGRFDAAILFDVLEHVVEMEALLRRVASLLRPGGVVLLSVPNVGHHSIVRDLIAGRWDYVPMGLLCYTHTRFFTLRTLESLLRRAGFEDFEIRRRQTGLPSEMDRLARDLGGDRESLATHGFHAIVRKPGPRP